MSIESKPSDANVLSLKQILYSHIPSHKDILFRELCKMSGILDVEAFLKSITMSYYDWKNAGISQIFSSYISWDAIAKNYVAQHGNSGAHRIVTDFCSKVSFLHYHHPGLAIPRRTMVKILGKIGRLPSEISMIDPLLQFLPDVSDTQTQYQVYEKYFQDIPDRSAKPPVNTLDHNKKLLIIARMRMGK